MPRAKRVGGSEKNVRLALERIERQVWSGRKLSTITLSLNKPAEFRAASARMKWKERRKSKREPKLKWKPFFSDHKDWKRKRTSGGRRNTWLARSKRPLLEILRTCRQNIDRWRKATKLCVRVCIESQYYVLLVELNHKVGKLVSKHSNKDCLGASLVRQSFAWESSHASKIERAKRSEKGDLDAARDFALLSLLLLFCCGQNLNFSPLKVLAEYKLLFYIVDWI